MRKLMKQIDMFCYKHPNFGLQRLMLFITVANVAVWLFSMMDSTNSLMGLLALDPGAVLKGQVWRIVTFLFVPQQTGLLAIIFFYFYYWIGNTLEQQWGTPKFNIFILFGALLTVIYAFAIYFIAPPASGAYYTFTAEYIYLSMFFSFATLFPDMQVLLFFIIPIKIKWLAFLDAAFFLWQIIANPFPINLLPVIAMLNYLVFFGEDLLHAIRPYKSAPRTVQFKSEVRKIKREQRNIPYTKKCSVCGKTDTDYPNLEFRFCSRCAGYHCFCEEHINNHIHFTE